MQIGIRLHDSANLALEERLAFVKEQGFTCGHLALSKIPNLPCKKENLTPGYASYLRKAFEKEQLDVAVLGCYLNLANPNQEALAETIKIYEANLRFGAALGASVVGTETGAPNEDYHTDLQASHSEEALQYFIKNLKRVVSIAEKCGTILAIEPVYKHIVWNPRVARRVLDEVASPALQIIFDPVNLLAPENLSERDEILEEAMDLLQDEIAVIHLKDYLCKENQMTCLAPGLGEMDYRSILRFVKEKKPYVQISLENTKPENAVAAREYLESLYQAL